MTFWNQYPKRTCGRDEMCRPPLAGILKKYIILQALNIDIHKIDCTCRIENMFTLFFNTQAETYLIPTVCAPITNIDIYQFENQNKKFRIISLILSFYNDNYFKIEYLDQSQFHALI